MSTIQSLSHWVEKNSHFSSHRNSLKHKKENHPIDVTEFNIFQCWWFGHCCVSCRNQRQWLMGWLAWHTSRWADNRNSRVRPERSNSNRWTSIRSGKQLIFNLFFRDYSRNYQNQKCDQRLNKLIVFCCWSKAKGKIQTNTSNQSNWTLTFHWSETRNIIALLFRQWLISIFLCNSVCFGWKYSLAVTFDTWTFILFKFFLFLFRVPFLTRSLNVS